MDNQKLQNLIERLSSTVDGELGFWNFTLEGRQYYVMTDETHDRMRIMTPVVEEATLGENDVRILLAANFDRALDARYAVSRGYVWSLFVHPLGPLSDAEFLDGVQQVKTLAENYGDTYASSDLVFQGGNPPPGRRLH